MSPVGAVKGRSLPRWSAAELAVVDRYVRAYARRDYRTAAEACRACLVELERRWGARRPGFSSGPRSFPAVRFVLGQRIRAAGHSIRGPVWTDAEERVAARFLTGLVLGKYPTAKAAGAACARQLARLRARGGANWPAPPRSATAVFEHLLKLVRATGRPGRRQRFTPTEKAVLVRYANALTSWRYVDIASAAAACESELGRLRRADPALPKRGQTAIAWKLRELLRRMGRPLGRVRRFPALKQVLDRYVARLAGPRPPGVRQAARECRQELARVIERFSESNGCPRGHLRLMTQYSMESELKRRSRAEGRRVVPLWTEAETKVVKRHARALLRGKFANLSVAAKACWRELNRKVWRISGAVSSGLRPRTLLATREKLRQEALTVGEGGRGSTR